VPIGAQRERGTNDVGASAGGHDFFARGDERWAHDRRVFAAAAAAIALLEIADERAVFERKRQPWREWQLKRLREILAQMIVDSGRDAALRRPVGAARRPYPHLHL